MAARIDVRPVGLDDIPALADHFAAHFAESGRDGGPGFTPYASDYAFDAARMRERFERALALPCSDVDWKRAWAASLDSDVVGHIVLHGAALASQLHRATIGMGIREPHRHQGLGTRLLSDAITWARGSADLVWLDLGVFAHNAPARALYERHGFQQYGLRRDCFRVDGHCLDDIEMTLRVD